ncbi:MAG: type II secretion system minor pseudopilin GspK [Deltaproteobacteria bacterium]|nr:type II secretion system minor pseudopilin GspK [Deltaproteobacteria bacterium]
MNKYFINNRGVALILVLMVIAIIVVVALDFNSDMRSDFTAAANVRDGITLRYVAKSGFNCALAVLAEDAEDNEYDTLQEDWANIALMSAGASTLEGFEGIRIAVNISDCSGKIQINSLGNINSSVVTRQKDLLQRFFSLPAFDIDSDTVTAMVDSIKDWIDKDDEPTGLEGAEDSYYQSQEPSYRCNNGPVQTIASLRKVRGFKDIEQKTFNKIVERLTPYGDGKININTTDRLILEALAEGMDAELAEEIDDYRREEENDLSDLLWYTNVPGMGDIRIDEDLITTESAFFEISSDAGIAVEEGKDSLTKHVKGCVERVKREGKKGIDVLCWRVE